jgi:hypothetical protein
VREPRGPSSAGIFRMLGVALLAVLCCAAPALLAGGALSGIGTALRNPWLITIGAALLVGAFSYGTVRSSVPAGPPAPLIAVQWASRRNLNQAASHSLWVLTFR